jgi:hypothetical protein
MSRAMAREGVTEPARGARDDQTKCRSGNFPGKAGATGQRENRPPCRAGRRSKIRHGMRKAALGAAFLLACDLEG